MGYGDGTFFPDALFGADDVSQVPTVLDDAVFLDGPSYSSGALAPGPIGQTQALIPYDQWGLTQIPTSSGYIFTPIYKAAWVNPLTVPVTDICLAVILDFLATFLVTDGNATAAWSAVAPGKPNPGSTQPTPSVAVARIFPHKPSDDTFSTSYCPALFMWRSDPEEAKQTWEADDWLRETTTVKGLWVYPPALADVQRQRMTFGHVLPKLIGYAIERGRTPAWVQPGDLDRLASQQGSLWYPYAGIEAFWLDRSRNVKLVIPGPDGSSVDELPAIEMTFTLQEKVDFGLGKFPLQALTGGFDSILNPQGQVVVSGNLDR